MFGLLQHLCAPGRWRSVGRRRKLCKGCRDQNLGLSENYGFRVEGVESVGV